MQTSVHPHPEAPLLMLLHLEAELAYTWRCSHTTLSFLDWIERHHPQYLAGMQYLDQLGS